MHKAPEGGVREILEAALTALTVVALVGCAGPARKAPVEDRSPVPKPVAEAPAPVPDAAPKVLPGAENAGKAGYYTVKPGDTLLRISLDQGQNWRDLARWNGLENPNLLEVGQVLRVVPPAADAGAATARGVAGAGRVESRPLDARAAGPVAQAASAAATPAAAAPQASAPASAAPGQVAAAGNAAGGTVAPSAPGGAQPPTAVAATAASAAPRDPAEDLVWAWPAGGTVVAGFDEGRNKGLTIVGKAGDPVLAASDGRVVYAGSSLRGYGNLVIVKHNDIYLTAYAHNQVLLVKDDQIVRRGQKIAEMGSTDAERVQLHFEIRRQGKPVDPAKLLPPR